MHVARTRCSVARYTEPTAVDVAVLTALVAAAEVGLVAVDRIGRIAWVNLTFQTWAGGQALVQPTGRDFAETFPALAHQAPGQASDRLPSSDVGIRWMPGPDQGWIGQVAVAGSGTPASLTDELTGLGGRPELRAAFATMVDSGAVRRREVAYLVLDLDSFKEVNDTFGHPVGDELLRRVARRITHVVGSPGAVFRLGGDEFGVLLSRPKVIEAALALGERLVNVLGRSFVIEGHEVQIGTSIGIAPVSSTAALDSAYREADTALYLSKHAGGGKTTLFEPQAARLIEERRVVQRDLKRAILLDQLELHYQPQLHLQTRTISGFETLVRWHHPELGIIPAAAFVPVAEKTRFIEEIGRWTLHEACRTAAGWPSDQSIVIAVTAVQFTDPRFLATVFRSLQQSKLAPERLILEVTKAILLICRDHVEATVVALHKAGVRISLDGAGSDYSSLGLFGHLSLFGQLPFERIKMDQSFVAAQGDGQVAAALIASHCSRLGMQVVAEGIETADQLDAACKQGCHVGQGALIGPPVPRSAVASLL